MRERAAGLNRNHDPACTDLPSESILRLQNALAAQRRPPFPVVLFFLFILLPIEFNLGGLFMTGPRVLLLIMIIPCCLRLVTGQLGGILLTDILFLTFAIWNIFTLLHNNPDQALSFGGSMALEMFGGYMLGRAYIRSPEDFARMCIALFWLIAVTLPFAVYESQTGTAPIPTLISKLPFFYSVEDYYNELSGRRMGLERAQVVFSHPIHYGLFCSTAFSLIFVGFQSILSLRMRFAMSAVVVLGVFFSLSSGAILPMMVQLVIIAWAWIMRPVRSRWTVLVSIIAILYVVIDLLSNRTPITVLLEYGTFSAENAYGRILIFEWGMKNVWDHPLLGIGLNDWVRAWFMHSGSMDNFWLVLAVRYGILGFMMVASGFAFVYFRATFRSIDTDRAFWQFRRSWVIMLTSLVLTLCTVDVWATALAYVFFLVGSGVWIIWFTPAPSAGVPVLSPFQVGRPVAPVYSRFPHVTR